MPTGIYIRTKEHNRKIGLACLGRKLSEETKKKAVATRTRNGSYAWSNENKKKLGKRMIGNKYRLGIAPTNKGKKRPEFIGNTFGFKKGMVSWNKGNKGFMSRDAHWNWKGGVTPLYCQIRCCFEYRQWRSDIFTRDNYSCVLCGDNRGGNLNAHHIKSFSIILLQNNVKSLDEAILCEELWNINNGQTLCEKCHIQTHAVGNKKTTSTQCQ